MPSGLDPSHSIKYFDDTTSTTNSSGITNNTLHFMLLEWKYDKHNAIIKYGDISKWDVSNVTSFKRLFCFIPKFNEDISNWDTSNVTDMSEMFYNCTTFCYDIRGWDVSNVTNFNRMFKGVNPQFVRLFDQGGKISQDGTPSSTFFKRLL